MEWGCVARVEKSHPGVKVRPLVKGRWGSWSQGCGQSRLYPCPTLSSQTDFPGWMSRAHKFLKRVKKSRFPLLQYSEPTGP